MNVDGSWRLLVESPMGRQDVTANLVSDGSGLTGKLVNNTNVGVSAEIFDGVVEGTQVRWKVKMRPTMMTLAFAVTVTDDAMSGKVKAGIFGSFDVVGTRQATTQPG